MADKKIEIVSRWDSAKVLFSVETKSLKVAVEIAVSKKADLRGADLRGADLTGADLRGADLRGADLTGADLRGADLTGAYLTGADLRGTDLRGADLRGAYLRGADLTGADLRGADLTGAYLRGAYLTGAYLRGAYLTGAYLRGADLEKIKNYSENHDIFFALIQRQKVVTFSKSEWEIIGKIAIHRWCWTTLKKEFGKEILGIGKKLAKAGWNEYLTRYEKLLKGD